jgi:hypothetical protein
VSAAEWGRLGRGVEEPHLRAGERLAALRLRGADLVRQDCRTLVVEGDTLDHSGEVRVELRVANTLPFLVPKGFTTAGRVKDKDAYDVVRVINAAGAAGLHDPPSRPGTAPWRRIQMWTRR